jgi:hypothetical protein
MPPNRTNPKDVLREGLIQSDLADRARAAQGSRGPEENRRKDDPTSHSQSRHGATIPEEVTSLLYNLTKYTTRVTFSTKNSGKKIMVSCAHVQEDHPPASHSAG